MTCSHLEHLSIKDLTLAVSEEVEGVGEPLPQELLINMVRRHPTLRWLRSDLMAENVAMLKQERPEIAFVSDLSKKLHLDDPYTLFTYLLATLYVL